MWYRCLLAVPPSMNFGAGRAPLRDFLVRFEEQRKENRKKAASGTGKIDRELVEYDRFNRSTNDLVSHQGRLAILQRRFGKKAKAKA